MTAKVHVIEHLNTFITQSDEESNTLSTAITQEIRIIQSQVVHLDAQVSQSGNSGPQSGGTSGIIDPKVVTLDVFDGDKKDKRKLTKWRKCFEHQAEHHYPGAKLILHAIMRAHDEVTGEVVKASSVLWDSQR